MSNERGPPFLLIRWDRRREPLVPAPDRSGLACAVRCAERGRADDGRRAGQAFVSLASSRVVAAPWTRWRWWCGVRQNRAGSGACGPLAHLPSPFQSENDCTIHVSLSCRLLPCQFLRLRLLPSKRSFRESDTSGAWELWADAPVE